MHRIMILVNLSPWKLSLTLAPILNLYYLNVSDIDRRTSTVDRELLRLTFKFIHEPVKWKKET